LLRRHARPLPPATLPKTAASSLQQAEARGWGAIIRDTLAGLVTGSASRDWSATSGARRRALLQAASITTTWSRLSRTPSLDAWRLGQAVPSSGACATQLCALLLAAGVALDPSITISPDPSSDLTAAKASAQMELLWAASSAAAAAAQQRRLATIVGAAVGGSAGLLVLLIALPRLVRAYKARRAVTAKAAAAAKAAKAAVAVEEQVAVAERSTAKAAAQQELKQQQAMSTLGSEDIGRIAALHGSSSDQQVVYDCYLGPSPSVASSTATTGSNSSLPQL
jgi:murein L,D-transpeptidase YcbB/YkuD